MSKLTPKFVKEESQPGVYQDGRGLILRIADTGRKSWIFRYSFQGSRHDLALGTYPALSLRDARLAADKERVTISRGENPLAIRQAQRGEATSKRQSAKSFKAVAEQFIKTHAPTWSTGYARDWRSSMLNHVYPVIGKLPPADIDTAMVLRVLEPIWLTIPTTAQRVRNRIELVLDAAKAKGMRDGENPARWRGHLDKLLPRQPKSKVPFPAIEWNRAPAVYREISSLDGVSARALEFLMLTACRSKEVRLAQWDEIDLEERIWTVPASRMKNGKIHRVPLTEAMVSVIESVRGIHPRWLFKKTSGGGPIPANALSRVLERIDLEQAVPHGFRSTFRTWAAEATDFQRDVCEVALAHTLPDKVEASYNRAEFLGKRRALMEAWSGFLVPAVQCSQAA
ncbi:integrase arm-type DNA-binding domain-containing protein (plasmid) [Pseudomonas aeruginosa]|uniref:tyrosine-type recombinase/integrase n=1 Tax=Pseudomonas aeruginosa TaxID=287 RepID=UPI0021BE707D|nr:site-specific integrase [Pseudomonas aeruginosa]UXH55906.1 integrase arm-type DNA-binding domain-containing protein [Pseudomonas aeruginosa]UXH68950.1 integrase arm-type DNA-binding domain-containing protein [Pseudomonas aeruginosa]